MELGKIIKLLAKKRGMTQKALAEEVGKSTTSISQIVNGSFNPSPATLSRIAEVLEVPVPILHFLSLSEEDIPAEKKEAFKNLYPAIVESLASLFGKDYRNILNE